MYEIVLSTGPKEAKVGQGPNNNGLVFQKKLNKKAEKNEMDYNRPRPRKEKVKNVGLGPFNRPEMIEKNPKWAELLGSVHVDSSSGPG